MTSIPNDRTLEILDADFARRGPLWRLARRPRCLRIACNVFATSPLLIVVPLAVILLPFIWLFGFLGDYAEDRAERWHSMWFFERTMAYLKAQRQLPPAQPPTDASAASVAEASNVMTCDEGQG